MRLSGTRVSLPDLAGDWGNGLLLCTKRVELRFSGSTRCSTTLSHKGRGCRNRGGTAARCASVCLAVHSEQKGRLDTSRPRSRFRARVCVPSRAQSKDCSFCLTVLVLGVLQFVPLTTRGILRDAHTPSPSALTGSLGCCVSWENMRHPCFTSGSLKGKRSMSMKSLGGPTGSTSSSRLDRAAPSS